LPTGTERILVVDDEFFLVSLYQSVLSRLGYTVTAKTSSTEALEEFQADPRGFDLLFTDQAMPGLNGAGLAAEVLRLRPDMPIILCTGYAATFPEEKAMEMGIRKYLEKPVDRQNLAETVRRVLDGEQRRS